MQSVDDPNDLFDQKQPVAIRTSTGVLDYLQDVVEQTASELLAAETTPTKPKRIPKLDTIATKEVASDKWRGGNFTIGVDPVKIATQSDERRRITIHNRTTSAAIGTGHVYLSSIPSQAGAPNTYLLSYDAFLNNDVVLNTKDDVWAICAAGSGAVLDIIEEFDMES